MISARKWIMFSLASLAASATLGLACETAQISEIPQAAPPAAPVDESDFTEDRAWVHLKALTEHGPRVTGTAGAERARSYITSELTRMGVEILEAPGALPEGYALAEGELEPENIVAQIPGTSEDLIVLVAPYDSRRYESFDFLGANDGASGAAVLLELVEVLSKDPLSYTTLFVFLDAEAPSGVDEDQQPLSRLNGSRLQAARFREDGVLGNIRILVGFNRVCDADLAITRDLGSHRLYREDFWNAAARLGYDDVFRPGQPFESVVGNHVPFLVAGARRVVFISDSIFGGDESPGLYADTEDDNLEHCSSRSLQVVGGVALEALRTIAQRLAKIDRFSTAPLATLEQGTEDEAVAAFDEEPGFDIPSTKPEPEKAGVVADPPEDFLPADAPAPSP